MRRVRHERSVHIYISIDVGVDTCTSSLASCGGAPKQIAFAPVAAADHRWLVTGLEVTGLVGVQLLLFDFFRSGRLFGWERHPTQTPSEQGGDTGSPPDDPCGRGQ